MLERNIVSLGLLNVCNEAMRDLGLDLQEIFAVDVTRVSETAVSEGLPRVLWIRSLFWAYPVMAAPYATNTDCLSKK